MKNNNKENKERRITTPCLIPQLEKLIRGKYYENLVLKYKKSSQQHR